MRVEQKRDSLESDTEHMEPADSRRRLQQLDHVCCQENTFVGSILPEPKQKYLNNVRLFLFYF